MKSVSAAGSPFSPPGCGSGAQGSSARASTSSGAVSGAAGSGAADSSAECSSLGSSRTGQLGADAVGTVDQGSFSSVIPRPCCRWSDVLPRGYVTGGGAAHGSSADVALEGAGGGVKACGDSARGAPH